MQVNAAVATAKDTHKDKEDKNWKLKERQAAAEQRRLEQEKLKKQKLKEIEGFWKNELTFYLIIV